MHLEVTRRMKGPISYCENLHPHQLLLAECLMFKKVDHGLFVFLQLGLELRLVLLNNSGTPLCIVPHEIRIYQYFTRLT